MQFNRLFAYTMIEEWMMGQKPHQITHYKIIICRFSVKVGHEIMLSVTLLFNKNEQGRNKPNSTEIDLLFL